MGEKKRTKISEGELHTKSHKGTVSEEAECIDPIFEDEKYLACRKIGEYYYSIYVKPAKPEVRDAIIFLNTSFYHREYLFEEVEGKASAREYMKIATNRLLEYVDENIGALRLFFTNSRGCFPMTGVIMDTHMWKEEFPLDLLLELIDSYDDRELFVLLLSCLHTKKSMDASFLKRISSDRYMLFYFLEGASYESDVKSALIELYDSTSLSGEGKPLLKDKLRVFILDYFNKYKEIYGFVEGVIKKEIEDLAKEIRKNGELSQVTDNFVFRRMLLRGAREKYVCVEFLPFCRKNLEYFANTVGITICVGNSLRIAPGSLSDTERVGEKLKLLNNEQLYKIMRSIFDKPITLAELSTEFGVSPDRAYKILSKLVAERYVLREKDDLKYYANKEHFTNIIRLLEGFGGEEE